MTVDPDSPEPLYQQLTRLLREQIRAGEIRSRLPSVKTLSQEHGVSHITVEAALKALRDEGLIVTARGKGSYVARQ